jgi:hypothetical protein
MWKFTLSLFALIPSLSFAGDWVLKSSMIHDNTMSPLLSFELTYNGIAERKIFESNLPWGVRDSLTVTAFTIEEVPKSLSGAMYPDDPTPSQIVVRRGQILTGKVVLTQRFAAGDLLQAGVPVAVCWTYDIRKVSPNSVETFTECAVIRSRKRADK